MCRWGDGCGGHPPTAQQPEGERALGMALRDAWGAWTTSLWPALCDSPRQTGQAGGAPEGPVRL